MFLQVTSRALALAALTLSMVTPLAAQSSSAQDQRIFTAIASVRAVDAKCSVLNPVERISSEQTHDRLVAKYGASGTAAITQQIEQAIAPVDCAELVKDPRFVSVRPFARLWEKEVLALWPVVLADRKSYYRNVSGDFMNPVMGGGECGPYSFPQIDRLAGRGAEAAAEFRAAAGQNELLSQAMLSESKAIIAECTATPFDPDTPRMRLLAAHMAELDAMAE